MIEIEKEKNIWITSDTHAYHTNICRGISMWKDKDGNTDVYRTRDFRDLGHMNDTMLRNINNVAQQDDVLIHLGDWSFGGFERIKEFRDRIICQNIYLILGNHDEHIKKNKGNIRSIFNLVSFEEEFVVDGVRMILKHYPISSWEDLNKGVIMLHGHLHSSNQDKFTGAGKTMDVGIDGHPEFRPYNLRDEIFKIMEKRPIASSIEKDRHGKTSK